MSGWDANAKGFIGFLEKVDFKFIGQDNKRFYLREFYWVGRRVGRVVQVKGRGIHPEEIFIGIRHGETPAKVTDVLNSHKKGAKTINLLTDIVYIHAIF